MFLVLVLPFISAGIGLKQTQGSILVSENEKACISYGVYNPFEKDTYATITLSDNLKEILTTQETETKLIPASTDSSHAIPIKFCFKAPVVYEKECLIGGLLICKKDCTEETVIYSGEVLAMSVPPETQGMGSTTGMVVSAPLSVKIKCIPYERNYTLVWLILLVISALVIIWILFNKSHKLKGKRK